MHRRLALVAGLLVLLTTARHAAAAASAPVEAYFRYCKALASATSLDDLLPFCAPERAAAQAPPLGRGRCTPAARWPFLQGARRRRLLRAVLQLVEAAVDAASRQQLLVRSLCGQPAVVQHQDAIGTPNGGQPMGHDEG